jgi:hypothetical protein
VDVHDVWGANPRQQLCLAVEALADVRHVGRVGQHDLESDQAAQRGVVRLEDRAHASATKQPADLEATIEIALARKP